MTAPLPCYQALEQTSARMVAAAGQGHWAEVQRLEALARQQVVTLQATGLAHPATAPERRARLAALKAVLRLDAQVRNLAESGWVGVETWLAPSRQGQVTGPAVDIDGKPQH